MRNGEAYQNHCRKGKNSLVSQQDSWNFSEILAYVLHIPQKGYKLLRAVSPPTEGVKE